MIIALLDLTEYMKTLYSAEHRRALLSLTPAEQNFAAISAYCCLLFITLLLTFFIIIVKHIRASQTGKYKRGLYECFSGANLKKKSSALIIFFLFFFKRFIIALLIVQGGSWFGKGGSAIALLVVCSIAFLMTAFIPGLFDSIFKKIIHSMMEVMLMILSILLVILSYSVKTDDEKIEIGKWIVISMTVMMLMSSVFATLETIWNIIQYCKKRRRRRAVIEVEELHNSNPRSPKMIEPKAEQTSVNLMLDNTPHQQTNYMTDTAFGHEDIHAGSRDQIMGIDAASSSESERPKPKKGKKGKKKKRLRPKASSQAKKMKFWVE